MLNGAQRSSLRRILHRSANTENVSGNLDFPRQGDMVSQNVVRVAGWAMIGQRAADVVLIQIDNEKPIRARRCEPRHDVVDAKVQDVVFDVGAGFSETIALPAGKADRKVSISVRAVAADGTAWRSNRVVVTVAAQVPVPALPSAANFGGLSRSVPGLTVDRPRVCVFAHSLNIGGGELYLQELLLRMAADDVADFLVICPRDGVLRAELESAGIEVHIGSEAPSDARRYVDRRAELSALLLAWKCDVVIANTLGEFIGADAAIQIEIPVAWVIHESFQLDVFNTHLWGGHLKKPDQNVVGRLRSTLLNTNVNIFVAEATENMFRDMLPQLRTRCIRYGIDLPVIESYEAEHSKSTIREGLGFEESDFILLCMGIVQERKSQFALVHEFAAAVENYPNAKLVIVGNHPSPYGDSVIRAVNDLGISSSVRIIDIDSNTYRWFRAADVLVSASDVESLPRSILEAMTFGVPVLAADVFGVSEVVTDGETGWLFESRNAQDLRSGLMRVLKTTASEMAIMSQTCRQVSAKNFDGQNYADEFSKLISDLSSNPKVIESIKISGRPARLRKSSTLHEMNIALESPA